MSSNGIAWVSLCIVATSLLAQSPSAAAPPATQAAAPLRFFSNGDRLRVTVTGLFEPGKVAVFDRRLGDGKIFLPYAGEIGIVGMSPRLAERAIALACFQQRGLTRPNVKVELVKAHDPATQDDLFQVNCGDWIRMRIWEGKLSRETQYVLCVGADGDIRFPGAGLIHIANHKWLTAEAAVAAKLKEHGMFNDAIILLEEMSDAEARFARASQRVWLLPPATQPTTRPDSEPRNLSDDPKVKFLALPWIHDTRMTYELHNPTLTGTEYSAVGRVEWVLELGAPVRRPRVIWETTLPDGFYEFDASAPNKARLFSKLVSAYEHAFGCTIIQERREIPVLILGADKAIAEKALPVSSSLVQKMSETGLRHQRERIDCSGSMGNLEEELEHRLKMPVIDETGLSKKYDVRVTFDINDPIPSIDAALRPLGLSLTKGRRTVDVVVVKGKPPASQTPTTKPGSE